MLAKAGSKIRKSIIFESLHYSTTNFEFHNVGTSIVGIIGLSILSKENTNEKLKVYIDNTLISRSANQHFLPRVMRKEVISKESISLALKCFNSSNLNKFGTGDLYLWNGYATDKKASQLEAYTEEFSGLRLMSSKRVNKNWALLGTESEKIAFNTFLWSKLFIALADIEAQSIMHGGGYTSPFIKGCIPDNWRELNTNEKIYQHFNLTQEEVNFVENYQVQYYTK